MPEKTVLIQPVAVERGESGWWDHPDMRDLEECGVAFEAWIAFQGLELQQWRMEADIKSHHPYDGGAFHCLGRSPTAPAHGWFLLGICDSEDGPCVSWARRVGEA